MIKRTVFFLVLNFIALALGGLFTGTGVVSEWYTMLNQAPWTPPGWTFGLAWTTIMICFSFYMAYAYVLVQKKKVLISLFAVQWLLNVGWNPIFFKFHHVTLALITITTLTLLTIYLLIKYYDKMKVSSLLLLPYVIWLCIATSLNAYILMNN